jgi:ribosomal protein S4E|tara:strand:- start:402 stop:1253 length:852 start_codon:yes stop_codon:yes gene_type:complete
MSYLTGYTIKPYEVYSNGEVVFTDGTNNEIRANQTQCEAYGYTYDRASGTCSAFRHNVALNRNMSNENNKFNGVGNTVELGGNTIQINGTDNTTQGLNNNCFINGNSNTIANSINNATVVGTLAEATATNAFVVGGNTIGDDLGTRQNITLMFGAQTISNVVIDATLSNTKVAPFNFEIPLNSIITFQTETVAVRTAGSGAGSVGDFKAFIETGAAVCNSSGAITLDKSRTTIANSGTTTGWTSDIVVSGTSFIQQVKGANNRTIEWATTMRITQLKAGVTIP